MAKLNASFQDHLRTGTSGRKKSPAHRLAFERQESSPKARATTRLHCSTAVATIANQPIEIRRMRRLASRKTLHPSPVDELQKLLAINCRDRAMNFNVRRSPGFRPYWSSLHVRASQETVRRYDDCMISAPNAGRFREPEGTCPTASSKLPFA